MKQSAGLLVFRRKDAGIEVFLVHPGGPFWAGKNKAAWSLPKGEFSEVEAALAAAQREFKEETGQTAPSGNYLELCEVKTKSGKLIYA